MSSENPIDPIQPTSTETQAPGAQVGSASADFMQIWMAKYVDFMRHLLSEHALVTVVVVLISYFVLKGSKFSAVSITFVVLFSLIFAPIGILIGDKFRQLAAPDVFYGHGMIDLFKKKMMYMYGPQIIGGLVGVFVACMPVQFAVQKWALWFADASTAGLYAATLSQPTLSATSHRRTAQGLAALRAASRLQLVDLALKDQSLIA